MLLGQGGVVTNQSGGTISGVIGIFGIYGGVSVTNAGLIQGGTTGVALRLDSGGSVTNQAGGTIAAYIGLTTGIGFTATIENAGRIAGGSGLSGYGLYLRDTATVTNLAGGHISGRYGIADRKQAVTISNAGTIEGGTGSGERGVYLGKGGVVTNLAGGTISGTRGVIATGAAATVRNAGTITGSTTAVGFGSGFASTLIVDAGAVFSGTVNGANTIGSTIASTMILASAASAGTISGLGSQFINFARTTIEAGADWTLTGVNTLVDQTTLTNNGTIAVTGTLTADDLLGSGRVIVSGGGTITTTGTVAAGETIELGSGGNALVLNAADFDATIAGFGTGETIALSGVTDALSAAIVGGNTLVVDRGANPDIELILDPGTDYSGATFSVGDAASDFITTDLACFAQGTRIETPDGPVPVETLAIGRMVLTASGAAVPVRWIGYRRLDVTRHPDPVLVRPIRVAPDSIAPGVPSRDVVLSPDHALVLDGWLIPVRLLANGMTIREDEACQTVTYYHVELDRHDVPLSDGLPVESYLDTGNRAMFENAGVPLVLHPDPEAGQAARVARSCLPFMDSPAGVQPVWTALAERAGALGFVAGHRVTCEDPALMIAVDGRLIAPASASGGVYVFVLPPFEGRPRLVSRAVRPTEARSWSGDRRGLGVMVRRMSLRGSGQALDVPLDHPALRDGWWSLERDAESAWRWTDGNAALPLCGGGAGVLEVRIGPPLAYPVAA